MKERNCDSCAWGTPRDIIKEDGTLYPAVFCHHQENAVIAETDWWCRHWSETTGWDAFEEQEPDPGIKDLQEQIRIQKGLLRIASELFEQDIELYEIRHMANGLDTSEAKDFRIRKRWLEEYRTKC